MTTVSDSAPHGFPLEAGALHDFKNLLTVIAGHSELLLARLSESDPLWRSADAIRQAVNSCTALAAHLLAASRRDASRADVVDLNELVRSVTGMLEGMLGPAIALETRRHPGAGRVRVSSVEMEQVIVNLAVNARDAMPDGGRLTIETAPLDVPVGEARRLSGPAPGAWTMLVVTDTGTGMEPWVVARAFEPYFTTKPGQGTGLGLVTARAIVERHGGAIDVTTAAGVGSTFRVSLPRVPDTPTRHEPEPVMESAGGGETILVAEDDPELRHLMREILELSGYRVLAAADANEALAVTAGHDGRIHLLIADVFIPGPAPRDLVAALKQAHRALRVLHISGRAAAEIERHVGSLVGPLLEKPFAVGVFSRTVRELLDAE